MPPIDYDGRLFRVASASEESEAGEDTFFRYRQRGEDGVLRSGACRSTPERLTRGGS